MTFINRDESINEHAFERYPNKTRLFSETFPNVLNCIFFTAVDIIDIQNFVVINDCGRISTFSSIVNELNRTTDFDNFTIYHIDSTKYTKFAIIVQSIFLIKKLGLSHQN